MSLLDYEGQPDTYAVMGNPIAHSKSPTIHALFARQTGQRLIYEAIRVEEGHFAEAVNEFRREGGKGLNITVPFKQEAWALAGSRSDRAERAGAVNTLRFEADGTLFGENTDGVGLVRDLMDNLHQPIRDRRVLLLGAGGAVRGVLAPLLGEAPQALVIANRTVERALQLADDFADLGPVEGSGFEALAGRRFDLVINGTAASLRGELPPLPEGILAEGALCYDMMYAAEPTPFMHWAAAHGAARTADGLGMLVEQAAESFFIWRGVQPKTTPVIEAVRQSLVRG